MHLLKSIRLAKKYTQATKDYQILSFIEVSEAWAKE